MPFSSAQYHQLQAFFNQSRFEEKGAVITDLDGTVIHEFEGRYSIPQSVELGLNKIYDLGRPVILNTLRFPLSVIRTFGKEWYKISSAPIPTVLLNGSQLGYIVQEDSGEFRYDEIDAYPLTAEEIEEVFQNMNTQLENKDFQLLLFYYPRDWKKGEIIWTPLQERVEKMHKKYSSASQVICCDQQDLKKRLLSEDICMIFILLDVPHDKLMAYQHTKKSNFYTHKGVDKDWGAKQIAKHLEFDLAHSIGAGDSQMDSFLKSVGLAVHVNNPFLEFEGVVPPIKLNSSSELGDLLFELAAMQRTIIHENAGEKSQTNKAAV